MSSLWGGGVANDWYIKQLGYELNYSRAFSTIIIITMVINRKKFNTPIKNIQAPAEFL